MHQPMQGARRQVARERCTCPVGYPELQSRDGYAVVVVAEGCPVHDAPAKER